MIDKKSIENYLCGNSYEGYKIFGAHKTYEYNSNGVRFTVYAPNAAKVQLVGNFNNWHGYDMHYFSSGVWSIFAEGLDEYAVYKYRIYLDYGSFFDKFDPFAFYDEVRPNTASIVYDLTKFNWTDDDWMNTRTKNFNSPISIYEIHLGSWRKKEEDSSFLNYKDFFNELIPYVKSMGYTHIELLPITEYPYDGSWGYQAAGYFSITSRYGTPDDFKYLVNECHKNNIGIIMDIVPGHFVSDDFALKNYDGSALYERDDENQRFSEWDSLWFDFTKPHVLSFIKSSLNFFISVYHIDGLRYDAVSTLLYNNGKEDEGVNEQGVWFLKNTNYFLQNAHKNVMLIAEDSSSYLKVTAPVVYGGIGFDYKWDFGWMHDTLSYFEMEPDKRSCFRNLLMHSIDYFYNEVFMLPISHDEVSHFKKSIVNRMYGNYDEKFSNMRCLYLLMMTMPGKKLNFMGNEIGVFDEWDDSKVLCFDILKYPKHSIFKHYFKTLQHIYLSQSSLYMNDYNSRNFKWINVDSNLPCVFAYKRDNLKEDVTYTVINLSDKMYSHFNLNVDSAGSYTELINTDSKEFDGNNNINEELIPEQFGDKFWLDLRLAPFTGCIIKKLK